jgi:hypothetical protein
VKKGASSSFFEHHVKASQIFIKSISRQMAKGYSGTGVIQFFWLSV